MSREYGAGKAGEVIDLSLKEFKGWPRSIAGEIHVSGNPAIGVMSRSTDPGSGIVIVTLAERVSKLEEEVAALIGKSK